MVSHSPESRKLQRRSRRMGSGLWFVVMALFVGAFLAVPNSRAVAEQKFMSEFAEAFPAAAGSPLDSCVLCHTDPARPHEENLNNYGEDWEEGDYGDKDYLAPALLNRDSDGDGIPNGQEIAQLSLPGDPASSTPPTTTTTLPGAPPDGQAIYAARCAVCHGPNGGDLTGTSLIRTSFVSITINGRGSMPPQTGLSGEEAGAIWEFVTGAVPTTTTTTQPGATTTTTQPAGGATVWSQHCAVCHGPSGGDVVPTTLRRSELILITTNGVGSMRGFPELGTAQIGNVADYLLGLSAPTTTVPGATTTTTVPRGGASVYAAFCAVCHGPEGGDLRGHVLSVAEIVSITTDGTGTMGGYAGRLSSAEIDNVSRYVAALGAGTGSTTTSLPGGTNPGATLYMQNCSTCHGLHGEGGPGGRLVPTALTRSEIVSVTAGGTTGMPGYESQLSMSEIGAIADHILEIASLTRTSDTTEALVSTSTTVRSNDGTLALGSPFDGSAADRSSSGTLVAIVVGVLAAGVGVFLWLRAARTLSR